MIARVSDLTSYVYCPRLCYYRIKLGEEPANEMHAAREIYISRRMKMGDEWALKKFLNLYGEKDVFAEALKNFKYNPALDELDSIECEVGLKSEKLMLKGSLDEIVALKGEKYPLSLSLRAPKENVWFKDKIRTAAFCMLLEEVGIKQNEGFVYHCFDGELRKVNVGRREKHYVLKLVERVLKLKKGFIPEKGDVKCEKCMYNEACKNEPSTFARFL